MTLKRFLTPAAIALVSTLGLTSTASWAAAAKNLLEESIDFKVTQADSGEVFRTFGEILSAEVSFDPSLAGRKLTLQLENVRLRTALGAACDSLGCVWTYVEGKPSKLAFKPVAVQPAKNPGGDRRHGLDDEIDIHLSAANVVEVLRTAAELLSAEARIDPKISGRIDLDLTQVPVRSLLTRICGEIGCSWTLVEGDKPVLQVTSTK